MVKTFQELGLNSEIIKAITELGFENPTAVQDRIIPTILNETGDIVCLAQTGTGKTAAFGLPTLNRINPDIYNTQALVLCPTRELCRQIAQDLKNYAKYIPNFSVVEVYGGAGIEPQIRALKKNPLVVVATPGRLLDVLHRRAVNLSNVKTLILDEADEMLNMGFKDDLDAILESTPQDKRVLLFSATLPIEVEKIAKNYMRKAEIVTIGERNSGSDKVKHYYFMVHEKDRYLALKRIADYYPDIYGIIFCRTRRETGEIASALIKDGYDADALHGDLSQQQRDQVMGRFKNKTLKLLVATDVAARGIDVNNLTHVINYNLPDEVEQYTHRSGRTGRADKSGKSIVIINTKEQSKIRRIEKMINKTFAKAKLPTGNEVCSKQLLALIDQIEAVEVQEEIDQYIPLITERWESLSREEIIRKFLSMEFNRFLDYYKSAPDLNVLERAGRESSNGSGRGSGEDYILKDEKGFDWIKLHLGSKHNITTRHIIRMLTTLGVGKRGVGRIDVRRECTYVGISSSSVKYVVDQMNGTDYRGKNLYCEAVSTPTPEEKQSRNESRGESRNENRGESKSKNSEVDSDSIDKEMQSLGLTKGGHLDREAIEKLAKEMLQDDMENLGDRPERTDRAERRPYKKEGGYSGSRDGSRSSRDSGRSSREGRSNAGSSRTGRSYGSRDDRSSDRSSSSESRPGRSYGSREGRSSDSRSGRSSSRPGSSRGSGRTPRRGR
ncbi:MAG: DEAD/DEAH box helicase [Bacteroidales bacterium]